MKEKKENLRAPVEKNEEESVKRVHFRLASKRPLTMLNDRLFVALRRRLSSGRNVLLFQPETF